MAERYGTPVFASGPDRAYINAMEIQFTKMHGIGNDVVVIDSRERGLELSGDQARHIADRHFGVGCDQVMVITAAENGKADIGLAIYNSDGSASGACGNGTRCVADLLLPEGDGSQLAMEAGGERLSAWRECGEIAVDMGEPKLDWKEIPLAGETDTIAVDLGQDGLPEAVAVNMGNPHAVHFVDDADAVDLADIGPVLEHHPMFPERANIEFASLAGADQLRMRVWERGTGITIACGSGACATLVAAVRRGLTGRAATVRLDGGSLAVEWREDDNRVVMRGPATKVFSGSMRLPDGRAS